MTIIQSLESDLSQSREYGGIRFSPTRTEAQKWLAALKAAEKLVAQLKVFNKEPTMDNLNLLDIFKQQWHNSIDP